MIAARCQALALMLAVLSIRAYALAVEEGSRLLVPMNRRAGNAEMEQLRMRFEAHQASIQTNANTSNSSGNVSTTETRLTATETRLRSGEGSHTIFVDVGGQSRELIIDTGSGKTAFICQGCSACGTRHSHEPFQFTASTRYANCSGTDVRHDTCSLCVQGRCQYGQSYVEGDHWSAYKVLDTMAFTSDGARAQAPVLSAEISFGCIYEQSGVFNDQSSDGIMGFSRHPDSIVEQLYRQKATRSRIFAQCLAHQGGLLTLGGVDLSLHTSPVRYTPLRATGFQYWTVQLVGVTFGSVPLDVDADVFNRDRGVVVDSGTTFLYLPAHALPAFKQAWLKAVGSDEFLPVSDTFYRLADWQLASFPELCFSLANDAQLCVGAENYFTQIAGDHYAGAVYFGDDAKSTILGASALTGYNIIYDVDNKRLGIARAQCDRPPPLTAAALATEMLSQNPGGDTFESILDVQEVTQWLLGLVSFFALIGFVSVVFVDSTDLCLDDKELESGGAVAADPDEEAFAFFLWTGEQEEEKASSTC